MLILNNYNMEYIIKKGQIVLNDYQGNFRFNSQELTITPNSHYGLYEHPKLAKFDCLLRAIYGAYDVDPLSYSINRYQPLKFNSIEEGNIFLKNCFDLLKKHNFKGYASSGVLGVQYYKYLPKGFIEIRGKHFYHYIFDIETNTFKKFDFQPIYNKHYNNNLYNYNFETRKVEPNKNNSTWV